MERCSLRAFDPQNQSRLPEVRSCMYVRVSMCTGRHMCVRDSTCACGCAQVSSPWLPGQCSSLEPVLSSQVMV